MNDEKKVSKFPGRRAGNLVAAGVKAAIMKDQPTIGGSQGDFPREKCGTCLSWRRDSRAGTGQVPLNAGQCMFNPPTPYPILGPEGQMLACIIVRPPVNSDAEGCDQHDDGTDDDDGGEQQPAILAAG